MQDIQQVFNQIQKSKKEQKEIRKEYKDSLVSATDYAKVIEQFNEIKEKKKQIEAIVQQQMGARYIQLEELKQEVKELEEMLSDIAISTLMNGKSVELKDENDNEYEPSYKVSFKKIN